MWRATENSSPQLSATTERIVYQIEYGLQYQIFLTPWARYGRNWSYTLVHYNTSLVPRPSFG